MILKLSSLINNSNTRKPQNISIKQMRRHEYGEIRNDAALHTILIKPHSDHSNVY